MQPSKKRRAVVGDAAQEGYKHESLRTTFPGDPA